MEKEVQFKSNNFVLSGTLTVPDSSKKVPAVLLVAGSVLNGL